MKRATFETFFRLVRNEFSYLEEVYGFDTVRSRTSPPREGEIRFQNDTTAVVIQLEIGCIITVWLCRLVDGKIPIYPHISGNRYILDYLIDLRNPGLSVRQASDFSPCTFERLLPTVRAYASALVAVGEDVLRNDFSVFPKLEAVLSARREHNRSNPG